MGRKLERMWLSQTGSGTVENAAALSYENNLSHVKQPPADRSVAGSRGQKYRLTRHATERMQTTVRSALLRDTVVHLGHLFDPFHPQYHINLAFVRVVTGCYRTEHAPTNQMTPCNTPCIQ